jgi:hemolysin activation/secretion protein
VHNVNTSHVAAAACLALLGTPALAQTPPLPDVLPGIDTQRLQQQRIDTNALSGQLGNAMTPAASGIERTDLAQLPEEKPCFPIREVTLGDDNPFPWLESTVAPVEGQCIGEKGLKIVRETVANTLIEHGYVTTRVAMPPQSLSSGMLQLEIQPGRVGLMESDGPAPGRAANALPLDTGDVLNQRDLDQALENIRRLASQPNASFSVLPGAAPGESDISLHTGNSKRWHLALGYDNAGQIATGKNELSASLVLDSPLALYDQLQAYGLTNADRGASGKGADAAALSYSVPFGYTMLTLDANQSSYLQTLATDFGPVEYKGSQKNAGIRLSRVVQRNGHSRTEVRARLFRSVAHNFVLNTPIDVQDRDVYGYEVGVAHRHYFGQVQLDASVGWRATLPGISKQSGTMLDAPDFTGSQQMETASVNISAPFRLGGQPFSWQFGWNAQNAVTPVTSPDFFTIGSRYQVRGFDQQSTLAAESGWAVSNELDWYAPTSFGVQAVYTGVDAGRVRGPSARYLPGNTLVGMVAGIKGSLVMGKRLMPDVNYDVSVGWPLHKPDTMPDRSPTMLVQVSMLI